MVGAPFIAADSFDGPKDGYTFTTRDGVSGYYALEAAAVPQYVALP